MKTIAALIFVFFISVSVQAQKTTKEIKVETIVMTIITADKKSKASLENTTKIARLYKFKNSRIKKALSFTTKKSKAKVA